MKVPMIISADEGENTYDPERPANAGVQKGDEVTLFALGKGVPEEFDIMGQAKKFEDDF